MDEIIEFLNRCLDLLIPVGLLILSICGLLMAISLTALVMRVAVS